MFFFPVFIATFITKEDMKRKKMNWANYAVYRTHTLGLVYSTKNS
jgi:hypothetical protein